MNKMKADIRQSLLLSLIAISVLCLSCEDVISVALQKSENTQLVVDGFINNLPNGKQVIKLSLSQPYFDNTTPTPALGATVVVRDQNNTSFDFKDLNHNGSYIWTGKGAFGKIGNTYTLFITYNNQTYSSKSTMYRAPTIDSVAYEYNDRRTINQGVNGPEYGFQPEFYARDFIGVGDCYWIKAARNGRFFNKTTQTSVAYDGGQLPGTNTDGFVFIQPVRRSIAREFFVDKDTLLVEVHAIDINTFYFLRTAQEQAQNVGIFATPVANLPTNIVNQQTPSNKALGFFCVSAVSSFKTIIDKNKARPKSN